MFWIDANPGFNRVMIAFIFSLLVVEQLFQLFQFQMFQFSFHYSSGFSSRFRYQLDIESDRGLIGNHLEKGRFETGGAKLAMNDARLDRRRRVQDRCFLFVESRHSIRLRSRIKAGGSTDRLFRLARCAEGGWEGGGAGGWRWWELTLKICRTKTQTDRQFGSKTFGVEGAPTCLQRLVIQLRVDRGSMIDHSGRFAVGIGFVGPPMKRTSRSETPNLAISFQLSMFLCSLFCCERHLSRTLIGIERHDILWRAILVRAESSSSNSAHRYTGIVKKKPNFLLTGFIA